MTQLGCEGSDGVDLFSSMGPVTSLEGGGDARGVRRATVALHPGVGEAGAFASGDPLRVKLLDGHVYEARVDKFERGAAGAWTLRARFANDSGGYVLLSTSKGETLGTIRIPSNDQHYELRKRNDEDAYNLIELGRDDLPIEGGGPLTPPP